LSTPCSVSGRESQLDVGTAWCAVRLERLVRNVDGRQNGGRGSGCPRWCTGEHDELAAPEERLHRSAARSLPLVLWSGSPGAPDPSAVMLHASLCRPGDGAEDRLRLESDELGSVDLDLSSAARLARALQSTLGLLDPAP
jgi:hypothetical protein